MKKFDIEGNGNNIEVSDQDFLTLLNQFVENCYSLAKSYLINHSSGLADFNHEFFREDIEIIRKQYNSLIYEIDDVLLQKQLAEIYSLLEYFVVIDERIIFAYKEKIGVTDQERKLDLNLKKCVFKSIHQQHISPPEIVIQFAQDSAKRIAELEYLYNTIKEKII